GRCCQIFGRNLCRRIGPPVGYGTRGGAGAIPVPAARHRGPSGRRTGGGGTTDSMSLKHKEATPQVAARQENEDRMTVMLDIMADMIYEMRNMVAYQNRIMVEQSPPRL
ncbi:hypothetical protein ACLOJK_018863, partial [Asimina triloba]